MANLLAAYWWLFLIPLALWLSVRGMRGTRGNWWILLLRVSGALLLFASAIWPVTGNIDQPGLRLEINGWPQEIATILAGLAALFWAQRMANRETR